MIINEFKRPKPNNVFKRGWMTWRKPIASIKLFFKRIRWGWQRATKGYCDADIWDIDIWFATIFPNMLIDLREKGCGFPGSEGAETPEKWAKILTEMADAWWGTLEDEKYENEHSNFYQQNDKEAALRYRDDYLLTEKAREDSKDKAFNLTKKWFFSLWD